MLRFLRVQNLAVVREVQIDLDEGLTVLTGETGAGKSILVDALTLLLGARGSADLVRTGADTAVVEGIFRVEGNPAALAVLAEWNLEPDEGDVVLRREVAATGKGRAFVNGVLQPIAGLRRLGTALADVYGQLEHVRLLEPATHLELLDHVAGLGETRAELAASFRTLRDLDERLRLLAADAGERARRADFLRFEIAEIEDARIAAGAVVPAPGRAGDAPGVEEDEALARERRVLANRTRVVELAEGGFQALYESEGSVLERVSRLARDVEELSGYDAALAPLVAELESVRATAEDVALSLRDYARGVPLEAGRLEAVEARLAVIERMKAKYGPTLRDVAAFAERARAELKALVVPEEEHARIDKEREAARRRYHELSALASRARKTAARRLEARVETELGELAMERTRFRVRLTALPAGEGGPHGRDEAEFLVSPNVGEEPRPLARVASGGELSRLLLALRTVASDHEPTRVAVITGLEAGLDAGLGSRVAVFDEVDAGIGGRVAFVLARKLRRLGRGRQVLCISHLSPVAAAADRHLRVRKEERRGRTEVLVEVLGAEGRVDEIGRMIAGDAVSESVRRHARELLDRVPREADEEAAREARSERPRPVSRRG